MLAARGYHSRAPNLQHSLQDQDLTSGLGVEGLVQESFKQRGVTIHYTPPVLPNTTQPQLSF